MASRKRLTVDDKRKIIEESMKPGFSRGKICDQYGVSKAALSVLMKNKDEFLRKVDSSTGSTSKMKSLKLSKLPRMEEKLHLWFLEMRKKVFQSVEASLKTKQKNLPLRWVIMNSVDPIIG